MPGVTGLPATKHTPWLASVHQGPGCTPGLAVLLLAVYGVRAGRGWAWAAAVAAPVLGLAVALPARYPWNLDTLGHLGLIYLATLVFVAGAVLSGKGLLDARRPAGRTAGPDLR